jgi:predicted Zn-dependent peptidase
VNSELSRLARETVSAEELTAAKNKFAHGLDGLDNTVLALELADWQDMTGDWRNMYRHPGAVAQVTASDIQKLAAATFRPENRTVVTLRQ